MAADRSRRRAGRIKQDRVEFFIRPPFQEIGRDGAAGQGQARHVFFEALEAPGIAVDRGDDRSGRCKLSRLAARCGAKIGDVLTLNITEQAGGQGGAGILDPPFAIGKAWQLGDWGRIAPHADCTGREKCAAQPRGASFDVRTSR